MPSQRALHDYYVPDQELSEALLADHRRQATSAERSLANRAGKAWREITGVYRTLEAQPRRSQPVKHHRATKVRTKPKNIRVRGTLRPEPDVDKLVSAFLMLAKELKEPENESKH